MTIIPYILLNALILVESGGNDRAVGDYVHGRPTAFGCLQIGDKVLADVRRISGHWVSRSDAFDRAKASKICILYLSHYATRERLGHEPTMEDMARIWNAGPEGWQNPNSLPYWSRVQTQLVFLGYEEPTRTVLEGVQLQPFSRRVSQLERVSSLEAHALTLQLSNGPQIQFLRSTGNSGVSSLVELPKLFNRHGSLSSGDDFGSEGQPRIVLPKQLSVGHANSTGEQHTSKSSTHFPWPSADSR